MKKILAISIFALAAMGLRGQTVVINELMVANNDMYLDPTLNFGGWVELYNPASSAVDLQGYVLSNGSATYTLSSSTPIAAGGFGVLWFEHNSLDATQVNFKLDFGGGTLLLYDGDGSLVDSYTYPQAVTRTAFARTTDGTGDWSLTADPTPGATNATSTFATEQLAAPQVSRSSELLDGGVTFVVTIPEGQTLRYTTDGTTPTQTNGQTSSLGVFATAQTTCYRFRLFQDGYLPSPVVTRTFLSKDADYTLPIVSIVSDWRYINGDSLGPLTKGVGLGTRGNGQEDPCNWNADWDRPVNFEYFVPDDDGAYECVLNQEADLESCGGWSRAYSLHSFKLKGTKLAEGVNFFNYPIFASKPYIKNKMLQIRNGGQDTECRLKDAALQTIALSSGIALEGQAYQPVHHFYNGDYYGVINIREPNNRYYTYANYGLDDGEVDVFEVRSDSGYWQMNGTSDAWESLVSLSSDYAGNAEEVEALLDIDEFINYSAVQLYLGNNDWPQNNFKGFRSRDEGRFRFVLYDTDFAFSTSSPFELMAEKYSYTWAELYDADGLTGITRTQDIGYVSLFFNLMTDATLCRRFADTFCLMGGSVYHPDRCTAIIDSLCAVVSPALAIEGGSNEETATTIKSELSSRPSTSLSALTDYSAFGLSSLEQVDCSVVSNVGCVRLMLNDTEIPLGWFNGTLLAPATLTACAPASLCFRGWYTLEQSTATDSLLSWQSHRSLSADDWENLLDGATLASEEETLSLPTGSAVCCIAFYDTLDEDALLAAGGTPVCINEVCAANGSQLSDAGTKGDWVELFNATGEAIDLAGMYLSDDLSDTHRWQVPTDGSISTVIPAYGHRLIWCDAQEGTRELHASFRLSASKGGVVCLTAADDSWCDTLAWTSMDTQHTVGRWPDGGATCYLLDEPTICKTNVYSSSMTESGGASPSLAATDATVIEAVAMGSSETDTSVYDLCGRRVAASLPAVSGKVLSGVLQPGVYIVGGRKVLIK